MFIVHTVHDTILIPPANLSLPTIQAIHNEIDQRYPNRILMDVGLVIARYSGGGDNDALERVSHGVCVAGQAGTHHYCSFRLIVFRPFVEEVCLGRVHRSTEEGIYVTTGFFEDIFVPAYWMLRPSTYEKSSGLWIWTPDYDDDDDDDDENDDDKDKEDGAESNGKTNDNKTNGDTETKAGGEKKAEEDGGGSDRYEMEIGAEIRFKVKSIHFARSYNSAKGRQAVVSTTDKPLLPSNKKTDPTTGGTGSGTTTTTSGGGDDAVPPSQRPVRKRSSSVGLSDDDTELPPTMHIVASICEDGLGLTSWWGGAEEGDEEEEDAEEAMEDADGDS